MSPYRDFPTPAESNHRIELPGALPPSRGIQTFVISVLLAAVHSVVVYAIVEPLRGGAPFWALLLGVLAWPLLPVFVARGLVRNTVLLDTQGLVVKGLFRDRKLRWSEVVGVQPTMQPGLLGGIPSLTVDTHRGVFHIGELKTRDPDGTLEWALNAAAEGRLLDITERVIRDRTSRRRFRPYVAALIFSLVLSALAIRQMLCC